METAILEPTAALPSKLMTEEEFDAWCDEDIRAEWVGGEVIVHSPASPQHDAMLLFLANVAGSFVTFHDLGVVLGPNVQVRRPNLRRVPDLLFIAKERREIIQASCVDGAPDLVLEIVSPDSVERDWREKFLEYEAAGVREYWVVDPNVKRMRAYRLGEQGRYVQLEEEGGVIRSKVLPGFWLRVAWLWQEPLPDPLGVLRELGVIG